MYYDKKKYEALITESTLFDLDKETETVAYKRESYRMVEYLYCYLFAVNEKRNEPYGCEIMEVATRCINNFDYSKGAFLHYFNAAWKQEYSHILGDKISDDKFHGIKITEDEKRNIIKYMKLAETHESSCSKQELYSRIATAMNLSVEKVQLIAQMSDVYVSSDMKTNKDGEEISFWEQISDGSSLEQELEAADSNDGLLMKIEQAFNGLQERQKLIVSDMITIRIWSILSEQQHSSIRYSFISQDVINECLKTGSAPSQRSIAQKYNRDEASISRTVKEFLEKLK